MNKSTKIVMWAAPACALVLAAGLAACTPEQRAPMVDEASQQVETPAADELGFGVPEPGSLVRAQRRERAGGREA